MKVSLTRTFNPSDYSTSFDQREQKLIRKCCNLFIYHNAGRILVSDFKL
jgi:hypothetical protein